MNEKCWGDHSEIKSFVQKTPHNRNRDEGGRRKVKSKKMCSEGKTKRKIS